MNVHIFAAAKQPATRIVVDQLDADDWPHVIELAPRSLVWCWKCRRRRWAEHAEAQVYYDSVRFWCAPGHGCKKGKTR